MKILIDGFHKAFESRIRLGIMAILMVNDTLDFISLREHLGLTDGNLASHLKALEKEEFIGIKKSFIGRKPNTRYYVTKAGKSAFKTQLTAMEKLIQSQK